MVSMSYVKLVRSKIIKIKIKKLNLGFVLWTLCSISDIITSFLYLHIIHPSFFVEFGLSLKFHNDPHHYLFTMPRTPDSFHWKLGLWLLQFNSHASFFVIFVHSKFVPFLTHSSTLKWKFIFRILGGSNSEFQIKISKFWITLTGIIWCSAEISWCYLNHCPYLKFVHHHDQSRDWTTINSTINFNFHDFKIWTQTWLWYRSNNRLMKVSIF